MKNKKGFTLIELLCVLVLISIITTMAVVKFIPLIQKGNKNTFCAKIEMIKKEALNYSVKYEKEIYNSNEYFNGKKSIKIKINELVVNKIIDADKDNLVINPLDQKNINDWDIIFYLENNNIEVYIDTTNIC